MEYLFPLLLNSALAIRRRMLIQRVQASQTISDEKKGIQLPQGTNLPLRQHFTTALHALEEGHRPQERHYELLNLATSPHYQRKGIASRLLGYGLEKADKEGVKVFLTASPMGKLLYRKLGFEELGSLSIDLREFGGEGEYCHRKCKDWEDGMEGC